MNLRMVVLFLAVALQTTALCASIVSDDFSCNPRKHGWTYSDSLAPLAAVWSISDTQCAIIAAPRQHWTGPVFRCDPFGYYRLSYRSRAAEQGYENVDFFDSTGKLFMADDYSSVMPSEKFTLTETMFRAFEDATGIRALFSGIYSSIQITDVTMDRVDPAMVLRWQDSIYASLPPLRFSPDRGRWKYIPKTMDKLQRGDALRIVLLGNSWMNDMATSLFEELIERKYPGSHIRVAPSIHGSVGCEFFVKQENFDSYVRVPLRQKTDCLIVLSYGEPADVQKLTRHIRAISDCEILLVTIPAYPAFFHTRELDSLDHNWRRIICTPDMFSRIRKNAAVDHIEILDLNAATYEYFLAQTGAWRRFMRDLYHGNDSGKQILARVFETYFSPKK